MTNQFTGISDKDILEEIIDRQLPTALEKELKSSIDSLMRKAIIKKIKDFNFSKCGTDHLERILKSMEVNNESSIY